MENKIKKVVRKDLLTKSEFARKYKVSRTKLDYLIAENLLSTEIISGVAYISISDKAILDNALQYKTERSGTWSRQHNYKPYMPKSEQDMQFEEDWQRDMGMID